MTLTITLTANPTTKAGVNFNAGYAAFFSTFAPYGFPLFEGPTTTRTTQIVHLDTPVAGQEANTRAVLLGGDNFQYTFANHSVSGALDSVSLVRLGPAYNQSTGNLNLVDGTVQTATPYIKIDGLGLENAVGVKGEVHAVVAGLMGGGPSGVLADPAPLTAHVRGEAHNLVGSTGGDTYSGTIYGDAIRGYGGNDTLNGGSGNDLINGGAGNDALVGGAGNDVIIGGAGNDVIRGAAGADRMTGGAGADTFVFATLAEPSTDVIADFRRAQGDKIQINGIDADTTVAGNQAFAFIGKAAFTGDAGELRYVVSGGKTVVYGDDDGNRVADFHIDLTGSLTLVATDFIL